ncbi:hypothetical protein ACFLQG_01230, partial [Candidatus Zixiibacteriota bacterium]
NNSLFKILKVYQRISNFSTKDDLKGSVALNSRELLNRYNDRIKLEVNQLFPNFDLNYYPLENLTRYRLIENNLDASTTQDNFISGIETIRILSIVDSIFQTGPMKETIINQAKRFISNYKAALNSIGKIRVDYVVDGFRQLRELYSHERVIAQYPVYENYIKSLLVYAEKAALDLVGINWQGKIVLRDSPHGTRLKFVVSVSADGPKTVEINNFRFHPYWDSAYVELESNKISVAPHQSYVKEYFIDIDNTYLEGEVPDSLKFTVDVDYGQIPLTFTSILPIWEAPDLKVNLEPEFYFVKPFPKLDIDRVVANLNLKIVITKPIEFSGKVKINFATPSGMFAGVYRQELQLDKGDVTKTLRVPFTISNLFELGTHPTSVELLMNDKVVAADTGRIRIASCEITETIKIAFMPDSLGMLEDILRMTDAAWRPLTDRSLIAADLEAYNVIVIGSGAFRDYPSITKIRNRFEDYIRQGGSIVILGQPEDFPNSIIPFAFTPTVEVVEKNEITNRIPEANILLKPYTITENNLLSSFFKKKEVTPAVISPSEKVFITPSGGALLSVSRLGEGQVIYCGLPLLEMISKLDIDAIHLFANMLNY